MARGSFRRKEIERKRGASTNLQSGILGVTKVNPITERKIAIPLGLIQAVTQKKGGAPRIYPKPKPTFQKKVKKQRIKGHKKNYQ